MLFSPARQNTGANLMESGIWTLILMLTICVTFDEILTLLCSSVSSYIEMINQ